MPIHNYSPQPIYKWAKHIYYCHVIYRLQKTTLNQIHTNQRIKTPVRIRKTSWGYLGSDPRPNLWLNKSEHFWNIHHSPFKNDLVLVVPNLTYYNDPNSPAKIQMHYTFWIVRNDNKTHTDPQTPNPTKCSIDSKQAKLLCTKKQMATRLLLFHPAHNTHTTFDRYPSPFQISLSGNIIFQHLPRCDMGWRKSLNPPKIFVHGSVFPL